MVVHSAGIQDRVAARAVLMRLFCRLDSITTVFVDGGYTGKLIDWAKEMFGYKVEVANARTCTSSRYCPSAGSSSAPSLGWPGPGDSPKTTKYAILQQKP